jgi:hypothetical protein
LIKIQLTKSNPKIIRGVNLPFSCQLGFTAIGALRLGVFDFSL